jgi:hypothetical protein
VSDWTKLEKGIRFEDFPHEIRYAGYVIRDQEELDGLLDISAEMSEAGFSDEEIAAATISFLHRRRLH